MGDKMIFANRYAQIEPLLARCAGLRKQKAGGGVLATTHTTESAGMDQRLQSLLAIIRNGTPLSQTEAREIIWFIDFLAVAAPDNDTAVWDAGVLKLASTLRQDYAKAFGEKAYPA